MVRCLRRLGGLSMLFACTGGEAEEPIDPGQVPELSVPDLSGVDLPAAYLAGLSLALGLDADAVWGAHVRALESRSGGCPDLYAGPPEIDMGVDLPAGVGWSWRDGCLTLEGMGFLGFGWWDGSLLREGDAETAEGAVTDARRQLVGDGLVSDGDAVLVEVRGEASDALSQTDALGYLHWVYSSLVDATLTGDWMDAALGIEGGARVDLYEVVSGGDADRLELRGDVFLFETRLANRFDSVAMDLAFVGPTGAGPDDCTLEPRGWIGLRDADAFWYDLVFLPSEGEFDPSSCDGCGTLFVRGLEQTGMEVCMDFSTIWTELVAPPPIAAYAWTPRAQEEAR